MGAVVRRGGGSDIARSKQVYDGGRPHPSGVVCVVETEYVRYRTRMSRTAATLDRRVMGNIMEMVQRMGEVSVRSEAIGNAGK